MTRQLLVCLLAIAILRVPLTADVWTNPEALQIEKVREAPTVTVSVDKPLIKVGEWATLRASVEGLQHPLIYYWWVDGEEDWKFLDSVYTRPFTTPGEHTVYLVVRDSLRRESPVYTAKVRVEQPPVFHTGPTGSFETNRGTLTFLKSTSGSVEGKYSLAAGQIQGTLEGFLLHGEWSERSNGGKLRKGVIELVFDEDWNGFSGFWGNAGDELLQEPWSGARSQEPGAGS